MENYEIEAQVICQLELHRHCGLLFLFLRIKSLVSQIKDQTPLEVLHFSLGIQIKDQTHLEVLHFSLGIQIKDQTL